MDTKESMAQEARLLEMELATMKNTFLLNAVTRDYKVSSEEMKQQFKERQELEKRIIDFKLGSCMWPRQESGY